MMRDRGGSNPDARPGVHLDARQDVLPGVLRDARRDVLLKHCPGVHPDVLPSVRFPHAPCPIVRQENCFAYEIFIT